MSVSNWHQALCNIYYFKKYLSDSHAENPKVWWTYPPLDSEEKREIVLAQRQSRAGDEDTNFTQTKISSGPPDCKSAVKIFSESF